MGFRIEKDIEDYVFQRPRLITNWGFNVRKWIARQYRVPSGVIDLLGFAKATYTEDRFNPLVLEIKNGSIKSKDLAQVSRYAYDIDRIMMIRDFSYEEGYTQKIVLGVGVPDNRVLQEAVSMSISIVTISCNPDPIISGVWGWQREYSQKVEQDIERAAFSNLFNVFGKNDTLEMNNEFTKQRQQEAEEAA